MTFALLVVAVVVMIGVSGLLAASETAIASLSRGDMEEIAERSNAGRFVERIARDPGAHANALTFSRVLLETMSAVLVTLLILQLLPEPWQAFLVAVLVMIVASFIIAGASPRSVGRAHPEAVLRASAWLAASLRVVLGPVADLLVRVGDRVTPGRPSRAGAVTSEEQLLSMVDEAAESDVLESTDRELIHQVVDFSDSLVREVMVARTDMITVDAGASARDALRVFLDEGISRAPVVGRDADDVRGVLYLRDVTRWYVDRDPDADGEPEETVDGLARAATFVPETLRADLLLRTMQRTRSHIAVAVDEYGGISGLVTLEDLIEEIVGDISDEYDRVRDEPTRLGSGFYRVSSRLPVDELEDLLDLQIDEEGVDSVGGLLAVALEKVPQRGDRATVAGLELTAERVGPRKRIATVLVRVVDDHRRPADTQQEDAIA